MHVGIAQGYCYEMINENKKAMEVYLETIKVARIELGERHPTVGVVAYRLGVLHFGMDMHEECLPWYELALDITGDYVDDPSATYHNIGFVYRSIGMYDKAEEPLRKALKMRIEKWTPKEPEAEPEPEPELGPGAEAAALLLGAGAEVEPGAEVEAEPEPEPEPMEPVDKEALAEKIVKTKVAIEELEAAIERTNTELEESLAATGEQKKKSTALNWSPYSNSWMENKHVLLCCLRADLDRGATLLFYSSGARDEAAKSLLAEQQAELFQLYNTFAEASDTLENAPPDPPPPPGPYDDVDPVMDQEEIRDTLWQITLLVVSTLDQVTGPVLIQWPVCALACLCCPWLALSKQANTFAFRAGSYQARRGADFAAEANEHFARGGWGGGCRV